MNLRNIGGVAMIVVCGCIAGLLLAGCTTPAKKKVPPVSVAQIVEMSKNSVPAADIIAKIRESHTVYRMKASDLAKLKEQGVPDEVIDYMQKTYLNAIARDQQLEADRYWTRWDDGYWYGGMPFGWSYDPFWYDTQVIVVPESPRRDFDRDDRPSSAPVGGGHHRLER